MIKSTLHTEETFQNLSFVGRSSICRIFASAANPTQKLQSDDLIFLVSAFDGTWHLIMRDLAHGFHKRDRALHGSRALLVVVVVKVCIGTFRGWARLGRRPSFLGLLPLCDIQKTPTD